MAEPIFTGLDLYVQIYAADDITGEPTDTNPLLHYCFFQNCSLYGAVSWVQRAGMGNSVRNLESEDEWDLFTLSVSHYYFNKSDLDTALIFNRDVRLYLEMWLLGDGTKADELHVLKGARATSFRLGFQDNSNSEGEAVFTANSYTRPSGIPVFQTP